ncbi:MAG: NAD(P)/FAD-dependent oxidoreductase [Cellvibrionaceae bacterium]
MKHYDLAVIGGSFSGLACAQSAALKGTKSIVLERKKSPGAYTQSTGIFVKEIAEQLNIPSKLTRKISGIRLYAPNMASIDLSSEHYYFLATDTGKVLDWMARQVKIAGGEVRCGQNIETIVKKDERYILMNENISCSYLVGADGAKSNIAKRFKLGKNKHFLLGAEYEVDGLDNLDDNYLHVFLHSGYAPGYIGWALKGLNYTQVGLAVNYPQKPDIKGFLLHLMKYFGGKTEIIHRRGGYIPSGGLVSPLSKNNLCLLGDAAGMVSPLTAGGIHPAIEIGVQLGRYITDYLHHDGEAPERLLNVIKPSYTFKKPIRQLYQIMPPPDWLMNYLITNKQFRHIAQIIFFHHRGIFCKEAWQDIWKEILFT